MKTPFALFIFSAIAAMRLLHAGPTDADALAADAEQAISPDPAVATAAIERLRAEGASGLRRLLDAHLDLMQKGFAGGGESTRLRAAIDAVCAQRDGHVSRLFWFTEIDHAQAAARASGKPILSLRLLGNLSDELSCANSRFFRTTLYANAEIAAYLRDHFILHWKSVRPVPKLTIDFGDGRLVQRTITGNSIHYILDVEGRVIDALPGLYGPRTFLDRIRTAERAARDAGLCDETRRPEYLRDYHLAELQKINARWAADLDAIGAGPALLPLVDSRAVTNAPPSALEAAPRAIGKVIAEGPILLASMPQHAQPTATPSVAQAQELITDDQWKAIAARHADAATLDESALKLIRAKSPNAVQAGVISKSKVRVEDPLLRTVRNFERSLAEDTVRNESLFHSRIHEWLTTITPPDLEALNSRVYAELFLTPESDPWLGLLPADTFTALENDGHLSELRKH